MRRYKIEIDVPLPCDSHAEHLADIIHDISVLMGLSGVVRWRRPCDLPNCGSVDVAGIPFDLN